jgi:hypothetical protein
MFGGLIPEQARIPGSDGGFSPIEQVWHLADLEREGFSERIRRLISEPEPQLPLDDGLDVFTEARRKNIAVLSTVTPPNWLRSGTQEGVGKVSLCDIPGFMLQHDTAHRAEIEAWKIFCNRITAPNNRSERNRFSDSERKGLQAAHHAPSVGFMQPW